MQGNDNVMPLREMLEHLSTSQLNEMMRLELQNENPDRHSVELILSILEEREAGIPFEPDAQSEAAWETYQKRLAEGPIRPQSGKNLRWLMWVASVAVVLVGLFAVVPQQAEAEGFWGVLARWKSSVLEFFSPGEDISELEHTYETDNPGLQQLYDKAVEMGIEDPLLPEWLEDYLEMTECKVVNTPSVKWIASELSNGDKYAVIKINISIEETSHRFYRDDTYSETYEKEGVSYHITQNNDRWVAVWIKDNVEYSISVECQEDVFRSILDSINEMEEN